MPHRRGLFYTLVASPLALIPRPTKAKDLSFDGWEKREYSEEHRIGMFRNFRQLWFHFFQLQSIMLAKGLITLEDIKHYNNKCDRTFGKGNRPPQHVGLTDKDKDT